VTFPYFAASLDDCLEEASVTGVRYSIWGSIPSQIGNVADGLAAIQRFIFDEESLTWEELNQALRDDFEGHEPLRQRILNRAPKYGNDDDEVDRILKQVSEKFCDAVHDRAQNPVGPGGKTAPGFMTFGIHRRRLLPASPDGRKYEDNVASSFSPALGRDRNSPTAVLKSVSKVDLRKAGHGSVLDMAFHPSALKGEEGLEKFMSFVDTFLKLPCTTTLQANVIDRETLLAARENPTDPQYRTLLVRVWGFSTVFVSLDPDLQQHVIERTEHEL
jgi:formate C-acetyltransferase